MRRIRFSSFLKFFIAAGFPTRGLAVSPGFLASVALTIFPVAFPTQPSAWGATYYVAAPGSDTNSGTQSAPFGTIQKAADTVNPGDTVLVADGTYTDTDGNGVVVYVRRGGTSGNWVTFRSQNKWGAKVDTQAGAHGWYVSAPYIIIQDFEITGIPWGSE
jgi:hypothetical protein